METRSDVLTFSTNTLTSPLHLAGEVLAHVKVSVDTPDATMVVHLMDVYPDGRSMLMMEGDVRLALARGLRSLRLLSPGEVIETTLSLGHISLVVNVGHKIRLSIASSCSPKLCALHISVQRVDQLDVGRAIAWFCSCFSD